jgi:uncharacterized membrane protein YciS (DUF1049 family)
MEVVKYAGLFMVGLVAGAFVKEEYYYPCSEKIGKAYVRFKRLENEVKDQAVRSENDRDN